MGDVTVKTSAEIGPILDGLTRIERKMDDVGRRSQSLERNTQQASKGLDNLGTTVARLAVAVGAVKLLQMQAELIKVGAAADRMETSLNAISEGQADKYIAAVGEASRGTISQMDAMTASARALRLGVVASAEDMQRLTEISIAMGRTMGISATQALNDLTTGIGRLSPMILDNLGFTIKLSDAYEEYATSIGTTAEQLTKAEQQQALLNRVIADGGVILEQMGGLQDDAASDVERLTAFIDDQKVAIGRWLVEGLVPWVDGIRAVQAATQEHKTHLATTTNSVDEYALALHGVLNVAELTAAQLERLRREWVELRLAQLAELEELAGYPDRAARAALATHGLAEAASDATDATEDLRLSIMYGTTAQDEHNSKVQEVLRTYDLGLATYDETERALLELGATEQEVSRIRQDAARVALQAQRDQLKLQQDLTGVARDLAGNYNYLGRTVRVTTAANEEYADQLSYIRNEQEQVNRGLFAAQMNVAIYGEGAGTASERMADLTTQQQAWRNVLEQTDAQGLGDQTAYAARQVQNLDNQLMAVQMNQAAFGDGMGQNAERVAELIQQQEILEGAYARTAEAMGEVTRAVVISRLSLEDQQAVGEGILKIFELYGQELGLQGKALDDYMLRWGLVTEQQLTYRGVVEDVMESVENNSITLRNAEDIIAGYTTGVLTSTDAVDDAIETAEREERIRQDLIAQTETLSEKYDHMAGRATAGADTSEDAGTRQQAALTAVETRAGEVADSVEDAFGRMSDSADASIPAVNRLNTRLEVLLGTLRNIKANSNITITTTHISVEGELQHGGPALGGHPYIVGEAGPELFVPSQSGFVVPNHALGSGGGIGSASITVNVTGILDLSDPMAADRFATRAAPAIMRELQARAA